MSEKKETDLTPPEDSKDRVGDILRKERITRRITVETIAKDLKLNVKYIKALEASEYEALPADPYVRVYLRSLAKYLTLDPEDILKKFYMERGMSFEKTQTSKIVVSMKDKEEVKSPMLLIAVVMIIIFGGFAFFAQKQGWLSSTQFIVSPSDSSLVQSKIDSLNDSLLDDSLFSGAPVQPADSQVAVTNDTLTDTTLAMKMKFEIIGDSVWVQVFSDGKSWKNVVQKNQSREFYARDSFNVHVGNNPSVKFSFNGKPMRINGNGVVAFKIDKSGKPVIWSLPHWNLVFKDRI
ncbi:MAG: DUF4115 domain-containing protein [Fibrobacter sp.]|nr:DUF4115 domain-containing protein [Fibrobacter sp.]